MCFLLGICLAFYIGFSACNSICKVFLIKFLSALCFALLFYKFSFSIPFFLFAFLTFSLFSVSVVDYFHKIIPVMFPVLLIIIGIMFSFLNATLGKTFLLRFANSLLGIFIGGGILFALGSLWQLIYKMEGIGGGDVKLMAGIGAFIGFERVLIAILLAAILGSITGLVLIAIKKIKRKDYMPFGPFLSIASFIAIFIPSSIIDF
ncbi:MAG: A24 family peptidase [Endomicrobium sp.]|nr:A24 family peptidase [Endomicrobium sp.]